MARFFGAQPRTTETLTQSAELVVGKLAHLIIGVHLPETLCTMENPQHSLWIIPKSILPFGRQL